MKIVIIGASGFLGTKLYNILSKKYKVIGTYSKNEKDNLVFLDASNKENVRDVLKELKPDIIVDTVALTSSTACEKNPELSKQLNYETAKNIVETCREINIKMIFISSSYLFDGEKGNYNEKDKTKPINEYAKTKIMAENEISKLNDFLIIRLDIMYGYNGKNQSNGVFNIILSGNEISLREPNQLRQPILVEDVVNVIDKLILKNEKGIFHVAGSSKIPMIDFLRKLEKLVRDESKIKVSDEKPNIEIKIPKNTTLNISKIQKLGIKTHSLDEGLEIMRSQIKENS